MEKVEQKERLLEIIFAGVTLTLFWWLIAMLILDLEDSGKGKSDEGWPFAGISEQAKLGRILCYLWGIVTYLLLRVVFEWVTLW